MSYLIKIFVCFLINILMKDNLLERNCQLVCSLSIMIHGANHLQLSNHHVYLICIIISILKVHYVISPGHKKHSHGILFPLLLIISTLIIIISANDLPSCNTVVSNYPCGEMHHLNIYQSSYLSSINQYKIFTKSLQK